MSSSSGQLTAKFKKLHIEGCNEAMSLHHPDMHVQIEDSSIVNCNKNLTGTAVASLTLKNSEVFDKGEPRPLKGYVSGWSFEKDGLPPQK